MEPEKLKPWVNFLILALLTLLAVAIFQVNTYDYNVFHTSAEAMLEGKSPYSNGIYYSPPHTIFFVFPFVFWGAHVLAFINVIIIMVLLVGTQRNPISTALIGLALILTPQILFVIAAVNIPGLTLGLGLWLLLHFRKGLSRAVGWTALSGRPQDTVLLLLYDGWQALRERDWWAMGGAMVMMLPTAIWVMAWIDAFPDGPPANSLSPAYHTGLWFAVIYVAGVVVLWYWAKSRQLINQYWLLLVVWQLLQPYLVFYALWVHLLSIRVMSTARALVLLAGNLAIFIAIGRDFNGEQAQWPMLIALAWITLMLPPREHQETITPTEPLSVS